MQFNLDKLYAQYGEAYDTNRYYFKVGDVIKFDCGAVGIVRTSAVRWADVCIHKRSLIHQHYGIERIDYANMPYVRKGEFEPARYTINKTLKWNVGDVVIEREYGMIVYLYEAVGHQCFYGFVLESDNKYYVNTGIYIPNPYKEFITA